MSSSFKPIHAHDLALVSWFLSHLSGKSTFPNGGMVLAATTETNRAKNPTLAIRLDQLEKKQAVQNGVLPSQPEDPAMPFLLATGQEFSPVPKLDPFIPYDQRVLDVLSCSMESSKGPSDISDEIRIQRVGGLDRSAARGLMEYWAQSGLMRTEINDSLVGEKWTVSGGGVIGELERGCLRMRI